MVVFLGSRCWWSLRAIQQKMCMDEEVKDESDFNALVVVLRLPHYWLLDAACVMVVALTYLW